MVTIEGKRFSVKGRKDAQYGVAWLWSEAKMAYWAEHPEEKPASDGPMFRYLKPETALENLPSQAFLVQCINGAWVKVDKFTPR